MVLCPLCLAAAFSWAVRLARDAWCFAAQVSHLIRSGTAGGLGSPGIAQGPWPRPALPGRLCVVVPCVPASGPSSGRALGRSPLWLRPPLGSGPVWAWVALLHVAWDGSLPVWAFWPAGSWACSFCSSGPIGLWCTGKVVFRQGVSPLGYAGVGMGKDPADGPVWRNQPLREPDCRRCEFRRSLARLTDRV